MQVYTYVTELIRTPPEEILSGPDTSKKIDSAISLGLTVGGEIVDNLGQFTTAASVLKDMFVLLGLPTNTTITRSTSDLVELKIWYSKNEKYTYVNNSPSGDGNYIIGAVTGKGLIDELVFDMYFYNGGNAYEKILTYNTYVTELIRTPPEEILSGPDTSKKIDSAISLGLTVGGEIVDNLGQFTTAASVLKDMFVLLGLPTNTTITRSTSDLVELKIWYSKNEKYTYVNNSPSGDGNYIIGAVTGKGLIDELVFDMYFYNGGNAYEKILTYNVNEPLVTPSFSKSDDAAIQYHTSSPLVELPMYFSCFNLLLML